MKVSKDFLIEFLKKVEPTNISITDLADNTFINIMIPNNKGYKNDTKEENNE